jgi:hypothetical protein
MSPIFGRKVRKFIENDGELSELDPLLDHLILEKSGAVIEAILMQIPIEQLLDIYKGRAGSESLQEILAVVAERRANEIARQEAMAALESEVRISGLLQLERLQAGEVLTIGLFNPSQPKKASKSNSNNKNTQHLTLMVRLLNPSSGEVQVLSNEWTGPDSDTPSSKRRTPPLLKDHTVIFLGTELNTPQGSKFERSLTLKTRLSYHQGETPVVTPPEIIGYIETRDGILLMDSEDSLSPVKKVINKVGSTAAKQLLSEERGVVHLGDDMSEEELRSVLSQMNRSTVGDREILIARLRWETGYDYRAQRVQKK